MATHCGSVSRPNCVKSSSSSTSKVRVVVRVRPFLPHEISASNGKLVSCISALDPEGESVEEVTVHLKDQDSSRTKCYKLDSFYEQEDNNVIQIFNKEVSPLIPGLFRGCNATVFAYGATGSGKTYTMQGTNELPGLVQLAMSTVLSMSKSTESTVQISYYEVYLERCYDLLELKAKEIAILDSKEGQNHIKGLSQVPINSMSKFHEVISCGIQRRKVAHTSLNDVSSRSHGVLVIVVSTPNGEVPGTAVTGKLNLVDLAGNEDNRRTCNEGIRLHESSKINQSLFALSNVIYALNNNKPRVPYRESKLTRILQDSLGGMSCALMVACLNPGEYQEAVHTVSLAARSRHISNFVSPVQKQDTPNIRIVMEEKLQAWLESKGKTKSVQRLAAFGSPFLPRTPSSVSAVKRPFRNSRSVEVKATANHGACTGKERTVPSRDLNIGDKLYPCFEDPEIGVIEDKEEPKDDAHWILLSLPDEAMESKCVALADPIELSPANDNTNTLQNSLRKVLSPVNLNIRKTSFEDLSRANQSCALLFESETPKTPSMRCENKFQTIGTPLDKFNQRTSNLKCSLIQEYINFLNTASREELRELKGIGIKRAEYIYDLRETSPLKSLSDLKKIGLSSKEVGNMFSNAAKCMLDRGHD